MLTIRSLATILFLFSFSLLQAQQRAQPYWQRVLGGNGTETAVDVIKTFDKGYVVLSNSYMSRGGDVGDMDGYPSSYFGWVVKLDSTRAIVWQRKIHDGLYPGIDPRGARLLQTSDAGILVIGDTGWLIKYDKDGNFLWLYKYPGANPKSFRDALENPDGSVTICGASSQFLVTSLRGWLVNISATGEFNWERNYVSNTPGIDKTLRFETIQYSFNGDYIVAGTYDSSVSRYGGATGDFYVAQMSLNGDLKWFRTYGGTETENLTGLLKMPDKTYVVYGNARSTDGDVGYNHCLGACREDMWILKIDDTGKVLNKQVFGDVDTDNVLDMAVFKNEIYVLGHSASDINYFSDNRGAFDVVGFKLTKDLMRIGNNSMFGGAGQESAHAILIDSSGGQAYPMILATTGSSSNGEVTDDFDENNPVLTDPQIWLFKLGEFNTVRGYAFYDYNSNGMKDASEPFYNRGVFSSVGQTDSVKTYNENGRYVHKLKANDCTTQLQTNDRSFNVVPASKASSFPNYFYTDEVNFALQLKKGYSDIAVDGYAVTRSRPGFETNYEAIITNKSGDTVLNKQLLFIKDSNLTFRSGIPAPSVVSGDSIIWNYSNLKARDTLLFKVFLVLDAPPLVNIGDTLRSSFYAALPNDADSSDNVAMISQAVRGAYDPNDKQESHEGNIEFSKALRGEFLTYMIRFQNTGNDTAINVLVTDTLDANLNMGSFAMIKTSHPYSVSIKGRAIHWLFSHINLPDSNVNLTASNGYILFKIRVASTAKVNTSIQNKASIYFDYNPPIVTNTATTLLQQIKNGDGSVDEPVEPQPTESGIVKLYPNPVINECWIKYEGVSTLHTTIELWDIAGRKVASLGVKELMPATPYKIELPHLQSGIYLLRLSGEAFMETHRIVVMR